MAKHPLVVAVEAILPDRPARFDVMRAYDQGVRDAVKALQKAIETQNCIRWISVRDGKLFISRSNFIYPNATDESAGERNEERYNLIDRMDGDIVLDFEGLHLDAEHVARMLKHS